MDASSVFWMQCNDNSYSIHWFRQSRLASMSEQCSVVWFGEAPHPKTPLRCVLDQSVEPRLGFGPGPFPAKYNTTNCYLRLACCCYSQHTYWDHGRDSLLAHRKSYLLLNRWTDFYTEVIIASSVFLISNAIECNFEWIEELWEDKSDRQKRPNMRKRDFWWQLIKIVPYFVPPYRAFLRCWHICYKEYLVLAARLV